MNNEAARLLDLLHRSPTGEGWAHYWTPNSGEFFTGDHGEQIERKISIWYPVARRPAVPSNWADRSVHFSLHPTSKIPPTNSQGKKAKPKSVKVQNAYISTINCVFAEFDVKDWGSKPAIGAHLKTLALAPTAIVDSGGGYHVYWILSEPLAVSDENREHVKRVQYGWVDLVKGDPDAKDLAKMPRLPGSKNMKPGYAPNYPTVSLLEWGGELYDYNAIETLTAPYLKAMEERHAASLNKTPSDFLTDLQKAMEALPRLRSSRRENYSEWFAVGAALSELGDAGLRLWESWSSGSDKFKPNDCAMRWKGITPGAGKGLGSLILWANEDNPQPKPARERKPTPAKRAPTQAPAGDEPDPEMEEFNRLATAPSSSEQAAPALDEKAELLEGLAEAELKAASEPDPDAAQKELIKHGADDEGNAQALFYFYGKEYTYTDAYGWMHYNQKYWEIGGLARRDLNRAATGTLIRRRIAGVRAENEAIIKAAKPSRRNKENTIAQFQDLVWRDVSEFDSAPHLLNCANGVVDLRTGKLSGHSASDQFTYCAGANYNPDADLTPWLNFLADVVGDYAEIADWLQMAVGYSISGWTREECAFYIHGPSRSGKGTFANCLLATLGKPLAVGVQASMFTARRDADSQNFDLAPLKPARLVFASETSKNQRINSALFRQITGNDQIQVAFKGKDSFIFTPGWKIWIMSNSPIRGDDPGEPAFWGRFRVLTFPKSMLGREDKGLKEHLSTDPKCREAVLAWAVRGAMMWFNEPNGLVTPKAVADHTRKHQLDQDTVGAWLEETAVIGEGLAAPVVELYASYESFCMAQGREPENKIGFGRAMSAKGFMSSVRNVSGKSIRVYTGLQLN